MQHGMFIVLDGNDGSGKATQSKLLQDRFEKEGVSVAHVDFPAYDRSIFGTLIGECLRGEHGDFLALDPKIASTLYALDRYEAAPKIRELLQKGTVVVADRYASANQIHQGGKIEDEKERAEFLRWLATVEYETLKIPHPDQVIYLDVPVEISMGLLSEKRAVKNGGLGEGEKDMVEQDRNYLERSRESAQFLVRTEKSWSAISCMSAEGTLRSRQEIHEDIWELACRLRKGLY
ncbi:thymidylate kinase [Patescibacteria group bacterium]|nr:thymidylate kinase [Patescibacteria group bacterium]MBU1500660.1 thymidylate kinase [Patescibacteria group bacterium]MBU2080387.1 thymidylate kinase [Patescibacteria group bacterium]MBU2124201.1 thymidylate kinase [Patescibacteria group bacterium]MBU2194348.1 thymidylate kinase [Patescibacteria group bacterium]